MSKPICYSTKAYSAASATSALASAVIERRVPTATDVQIQILYCGVCHSDLHFVRDEWHFTQYPAVPGHEIVGHVTAVGSGVKKFKVGDTVGVGASSTPAAPARIVARGWNSFATTEWS